MEKRKDTPKQQVPTWNYIQNPVINDNGKEYEKVCLHACVCMCVCKLNHFAIYTRNQHNIISQFSSIQFSHVRLLATQWTAARQAPLSITNSQSPPKSMSIESVMPSKHLILCRPVFLLPSIFPSIRVFSSESALRIRWPKYWSFSFNISPSNEHPGLISPLGWTGWISLQSKGLSRVFSNTTVQRHQFFGAQFSL